MRQLRPERQVEVVACARGYVVSMCVCIYVYVYACMNMLVCIHTYMYVCLHLYAHEYMHKYALGEKAGVPVQG